MDKVINIAGNCATIYGPVRSRRHGLSLGINLGDSGTKVCTWGCVYCQCGYGKRGEPISAARARERESENLPQPQAVLAKLKEAVGQYPELDSVTIAGNSEPTAHPQFSDIVNDVLAFRRKSGGKWVFNCLSNGSELDRERVRDACDALDEIWLKLDCGEDELLHRLNRPLPRVGGVADHVRRIKLLEKPRIQTLLWLSPDKPTLGNFNEQNLAALLRAYDEIRPLAIHLTTVKRATAAPGLAPVSKRELEAFAARVREKLGLPCAAFV